MKKIIKFFLKIIFIFSFSGGLYLLLELIYKQHSDISMYLLAGSLGIVALLFNNIFTYETDFSFQCIMLMLLATLLEGIVGNIVNINYTIWDYRNLPLSFWNNQINLFFCCIWFILFFIIIPLLDYIEWTLFDYKPDVPPYYKIFGKIRFQFKQKK